MYDLAPLGIEPISAVAAMVNEVNELLELNDAKVQEARCGYFAIDSATPADFQEEFYDLKAGRVLAGIRFLNGAREEPFVHILPGFKVGEGDLPELNAFAREKFRLFTPKQFSLWRRPSALPSSGRISRCYLAGQVEKIRLLPQPPGIERVELKTQALDYAWYESLYADFHGARPELKNLVPLTERGELENELLRHIWIDGKLAGLIGASASPLLGRSGIYFTEILLGKEFKGQGLAAAAQRKFLAGTSAEIAWGTIDASNEPSTKTALRCGRARVREEVFYSVRDSFS